MSELSQTAIDTGREIERKINEFFDAANGVLDWVPGPLEHLVGPIVRALSALRRKVDEFWGKVNEFFSQPGDEVRLKQVAGQWEDAVAYPVGDISGTIALDKLKTHIEWEGRAAEAYESTVPAQIKGLTAMKDLGIQMRDSLNTLADAIEHFWTIIKGVFIGLAAAAGVALLGAATVVGLPAAAGVLVAAVGAAIAAVVTTIDTVDSTVDTIVNQQNAIEDKVRALGDRWSKTNTDAMSDQSDWEIE